MLCSELSLNDNQFNGTFPSTLINLQLVKCELDTIHCCQSPWIVDDSSYHVCLACCVHACDLCSYVYAQNNMLTGAVPDVFGNLKQLLYVLSFHFDC